jgi:hypothetical protein
MFPKPWQSSGWRHISGGGNGQLLEMIIRPLEAAGGEPEKFLERPFYLTNPNQTCYL